MAGTSAGAAVMSRVMVTGDEKRPLSKDDAWQTIEADNVVTRPGLGFLEDVIVDQHFVRRKRHNRIITLVLERPDLLGMAIDEATAVWVKPDRTCEVLGDGPVVIVNGRGASVARDEVGAGIRGANLMLHVLRSGAQFDLDSRKVLKLTP
jgi:cyanophycinase